VAAEDDDGVRRNNLLAALRARDLNGLAAHIERVSLGQGEVLFEPDQECRSVWFPERCVISLMVVMEGGQSAEAASVGREGMVGAMGVLGGHRTVSRALVIVPGSAIRLPASVLRDRFEASAALRRLCLCHADALLAQVLQLSACAALHPLEARLCRVLLQLEDRTAPDQQLPLTQDFLAEMLGVHRTTVTQVAKALQRAEVIAYRRGRVSVLDRALLERGTCECYGTVRGRYERLSAMAGG
jgi:CRP-like cAMP-binding protein